MERIYIPVKEYSGSNPKKRQKHNQSANVAIEMETYLNRRLRDHDSGPLVIMYSEIAKDINQPIKLVEEIGFSFQGGHDGITLTK